MWPLYAHTFNILVTTFWPLTQRSCPTASCLSTPPGACMLSLVRLLWPRGLQPARLLCPWDFPGKNTGVGCHFLLQGLSSRPRDQTCIFWISCIAGRFFTTRTTGESKLRRAQSYQDWATSHSLFTFMHWRRKWQPTPVFLPGESQGQRSLVGCRLWGRTELDTTEAT